MAPAVTAVMPAVRVSVHVAVHVAIHVAVHVAVHVAIHVAMHVVVHLWRTSRFNCATRRGAFVAPIAARLWCASLRHIAAQTCGALVTGIMVFAEHFAVHLWHYIAVHSGTTLKYIAVNTAVHVLAPRGDIHIRPYSTTKTQQYN